MIDSLKFMNFVDNYQCAYIVLDFQKKCILYCNKSAKSLYGVTVDMPDLEPIFKNHNKTLLEMFTIDMKAEHQGDVLVSDVVTILASGESQLADLHLGYFNQEEHQAYLEIMPKTSSRLDMMRKIIDQSSKPTLVLNMDSLLSIRYCSPNTREMYKMPEDGNLSSCFLPIQRDALVAEILTHFADGTEDTFYKHLQINRMGQEILWYALTLDRVLLDSGENLLVSNMICIEEQVNIQEQFDNTNQYFNILQNMCKGLLYRFDVHSRTLYRNEVTAKTYNMPEATPNFPSDEWLSTRMPEEDRAGFQEFMNQVSLGIDGSHEAGVRVPTGEFEHHRFTFQAIRHPDGSVREMVGCAMNIHHLKETQRELEHVNKQYEAFQELSEDLIFRVDLEKKLLTSHGKKLGLFGSEQGELLLTQGCESIFPEDLCFYEEFVSHALHGLGGTVELRMREAEGLEYGYRRLTWVPVKNLDGKVQEMVGKLVDVQEVKALQERADYDSLTNTLNKRAMLEASSQILSRCSLQEQHALFFMDLDDFKYVNDNMGHIFGDFVLKELGQRLKDSVRFHDLVGRVGGDEFVIFLRDIPNVEILMGKAKMLLSTISEDFSDGNHRHNIHGSLGISIFPQHGTTYEELYHHADMALYESKHKGKNTVNLYTPKK